MGFIKTFSSEEKGLIMKQTFVPKYNYAKAIGNDVRISTKSAEVLCNVIRNKPLTRARRLLEGLVTGDRNLKGKYYSKTSKAMLNLLNSCEKNAEFKGLEIDRLFVHASAHIGPNMRRRRRKGSFGTRMKSTHVEVMLIERGKQPKDKVSKKKINEQVHKKENETKQEAKKEMEEIREKLDELEQEQQELKKDVETAEKQIKNKNEPAVSE